MSIAQKIGWVVGSLVVSSVIFDIVGVVLWFMIDVFGGRNKSLAACYAVWFVMGVFVGVMHYSTAMDACRAKATEGATRALPSKWTGILIIALSAVVLVLLSFVFDHIWWRHNVEFDGFAPDNASPTLTFFVSIICTMCFLRYGEMEYLQRQEEMRRPEHPVKPKRHAR